MTKITFFKRDGAYFGFRETGHTGYGESGDDIICAALSAMTTLIVNTLELGYGARVDYTINDSTTEIAIKVKQALPEFEENESVRFAVCGLLAGYMAQLADMREEYYDFIDVDETEDEPV